MKAFIPVIIEDQLTQLGKMIRKPFENIGIEDDYFLDGPISNRVAVLDFDEKGKLREGVKVITHTGKDFVNYGDLEEVDIHSDSFIQRNVFGIVYKTLEMFEEADNLGRKVQWAFPSSQLLVVPRAGQWANAFYERASCSLQFFYFPSAKTEGETIFTSLSHDIVAHETGHAILDGIAPDLYHAISPQSLALHEAIADLTALVMSFRSNTLRATILNQTNGEITDTTAFSTIANEFGTHAEAGSAIRPLRNLKNTKKLDSSSSRTEPHELSEILTGGLYEIMILLYEKWLEKRMAEKNQARFNASGFALFAAGEQFKRMVFRALDYLPPGDISFADYGRAIIAADQTGHKKFEEEREWIAKEFVNRGIASHTAELTDESISGTNKQLLNDALEKTDLQQLVESNWVAYTFVSNNRQALGIPPEISFEIRDRKQITKIYYLQEGEKNISECLLKISWNKEELNPAGIGLPSKRIIPVGVTLAIDWESKKVLSYLVSDQSSEQKNARDQMVLALHDKGLLTLTQESFHLKDVFLSSGIEFFVSNDVMRLRNTAHMLHINRGY